MKIEVKFGQAAAKKDARGKGESANDRWWISVNGKPLCAGGGRIRTFTTEAKAQMAADEEAEARRG